MKKLTKQRIAAPFLSVSPMLIYIVLSVVLGVAIGVLLALTGNGNISEEELLNSPAVLFADEAMMGAGAALGCLFVRLRNKTRISGVFKLKNFDISVPLMLMIFGWAAGELCDHFGGLILSRFMTVEPNRDIPEGWAGVVLAVICAPVFEELIFRYCAVEFPRGSYSVPVICIANGLFFAFVHFYNVQGFFNVFIGGVAAAYVYCKTRNILYTMLEHAIHNAVCCIPLDPVYYKKNGFVLSQWWWIALNAVLLAVTVVWYFKYFRKKYTQTYFEINRETGLPEPEIVKRQASGEI